ncbi:MAG TPA: glycosyl hydrolase [Bryobacteraceae bacterium]|nr:glycosyl hydrolase [Bryobacteraceae bacterium]
MSERLFPPSAGAGCQPGHRIPSCPTTMVCVLLAAVPVFSASRSHNPTDSTVDYATFQNPPGDYHGTRWITLRLANATDASVIAMIDQAAASGAYGSFMITPDGGKTTALSEAYMKGSRRPPSDTGIAYLSEDYFRLYKAAVEEGEKQHLPLRTLYDELQYPSGMAGGLFFTKYPEEGAKSLEEVEKNVTGPARVELEIPLPDGIYVGAVLFNRDNFERLDVSAKKTAKGMACDVPKGNWKAMLFYLDRTFRPNSTKGGFMDYLSPQAVDHFIHLTFDAYYEHLKPYFGSTIQMTFYDEPSMHLSDGRMWTAGFNAAFENKYGFSPMKYYPALWYDIGPETAAARNALFGFRTEMYAENYIGRVAAWCAAHGIDMSGHQDQEETRNPVPISGDIMKVFKEQQIPGIDDIYYNGRSNVSYKLVTSAAFNWDKPLTMAETYAAYRQMTGAKAYKTAMDQMAMGVNLQIGNRPAAAGKDLDAFIARSAYLLRHGRHVADIAMLYPIASLQADYYFASPPTSNRPGSAPWFYWALEGGLIQPENDYMDLGEMLYRGLRIDYTYLHPEVLIGRSTIANGRITLNNQENREEFRVLIVPGGDTLSADAAKRIVEFYRAGGVVIATHKLPTRSAEFGRDREVRDMVGEVFGFPERDPITAEIRPMIDDYKNYFASHNAAGGRSYFLPQPDLKQMTALLKEAIPVADVDIQQPPMWPVKMGPEYDGALTYIHKVKDGHDIYFFANSKDTTLDTKVVLRGNKNLAFWNPQTGERQAAETGHAEAGGQPVTAVQLALRPVSAVFLVSE